MSTNIKNDLQSFYQSLKLPLPVYKSTIVSGVDHAPLWRTTITFLLDGDEKRLISEMFPRKIHSQCDAARKALDMILKSAKTLSSRAELGICTVSNSTVGVSSSARDDDITQMFYHPSTSCPTLSSIPLSSITSIRVTPERIVMIVDMENMPKWIETVFAEYPRVLEKMDVYAVVGEYTTLAPKALPAGVERILCPCCRPDGADTCIQMITGFFLAQDKYNEYIIASHDKFAHTVIDLITHDGLFWKRRHGRVATQLKHIEHYMTW